jgi:hypothetical protein
MSDTNANLVEGISAFVGGKTEDDAIKAARKVQNARGIAVGHVLYVEDFGDGMWEVVLQRLNHSTVKPIYSTAGTTSPVLIGYRQVAQ